MTFALIKVVMVAAGLAVMTQAAAVLAVLLTNP